MKKKNNKKGFTLIELLVVIAIIGLLSTLAVIALSKARQKARDTKRESDAKVLQTAVEMYATDNGAPPAVTTSWSALGTELANQLPQGIPEDPNKTPTNIGDLWCYCVNGQNYLIAVVLEKDGEVSGDLDTNSTGINTAFGGALTGKCICSDDSAASTIDCSDSNGGEIITGSNKQSPKTVFCLGNLSS